MLTVTRHLTASIASIASTRAIRARRSLAVLALTVAGASATVFACSAFSGSDTPNNAGGSDSATSDGTSRADGATIVDAGAPTFCSMIEASFCDDFERDPADAKGPWTNLFINGFGSTLVIGDGGGDAGSVAIAQVTSTENSANSVFLSVALPAIMTTGELSFDVMFRGIGGNTEMGGFDFGNNGNDTGRLIFLKQDQTNTVLGAQFEDSTRSLVLVSNQSASTLLAENTWYRIRIDVALSDGGLVAMLFADNALIAQVTPIGETYEEGYSPAPPTIDVGIHAAQGDGGLVTVLVDNVVVTY